MSSYKETRVDIAEFRDDIRHGMPLAIDDMSLAHHLGIRNKTMWWLINSKYAKKPRNPRPGWEPLYKVFSIPKRGKSGQRGNRRQIQNPSPRLKAVQRLILGRFLSLVPMGQHVGAYVVGRSCMDTAAQHVGKGVIVSMDIENFFPSVKRSMVRNWFKWAGYNHAVAGYLADLLTYKKQVPQGSPASGLLANIIADYAFDHKVMDLLRARDPQWCYTRYSDDIDISHPEMQSRDEINSIVGQIQLVLRREGFTLNSDKTSIEPYYKHQRVLGVVVNEKPNIPRWEYDHIRCLIHNCLMHGFRSQLTRAGKNSSDALKDHIKGKLSYFTQINADRAETLKLQLAIAEEVHGDEDTEDRAVEFKP